MNCAVITTTGGGGSASTPFASRPQIFKANIANGCSTVEGSDVLFPNPGPPGDVTNAGTKTAAPVGTCDVAVGGGSSGGGSSSSPSSSANVVAPAPSAPAASQVSQPSSQSTTRAAGGASSSAGL